MDSFISKYFFISQEIPKILRHGIISLKVCDECDGFVKSCSGIETQESEREIPKDAPCLMTLVAMTTKGENNNLEPMGVYIPKESKSRWLSNLALEFQSPI